MTSWSSASPATAGQDPPLHRTGRAGRFPQSRCHYAVSDVTHLRDVFAALDADLKKRGRNDWVSEEMEVLTSPKTYDFQPRARLGTAETRVAQAERNSRC